MAPAAALNLLNTKFKQCFVKGGIFLTTGIVHSWDQEKCTDFPALCQLCNSSTESNQETRERRGY